MRASVKSFMGRVTAAGQKSLNEKKFSSDDPRLCVPLAELLERLSDSFRSFEENDRLSFFVSDLRTIPESEDTFAGP